MEDGGRLKLLPSPPVVSELHASKPPTLLNTKTTEPTTAALVNI